MEVPKRRGRPPGSKNKPKPVALTPPAVFSPTEWAREEEFQLHLAALYQESQQLKTPASAVKVVLYYKVAMGSSAEQRAANTHKVDWPANWRLPEVGDFIRLRPNYEGVVQLVRFDLAAGVVEIMLR
jgi:hypothetical protein